MKLCPGHMNYYYYYHYFDRTRPLCLYRPQREIYVYIKKNKKKKEVWSNLETLSRNSLPLTEHNPTKQT